VSKCFLKRKGKNIALLGGIRERGLGDQHLCARGGGFLHHKSLGEEKERGQGEESLRREAKQVMRVVLLKAGCGGGGWVGMSTRQETLS